MYLIFLFIYLFMADKEIINQLMQKRRMNTEPFRYSPLIQDFSLLTDEQIKIHRLVHLSIELG